MNRRSVMRLSQGNTRCISWRNRDKILVGYRPVTLGAQSGEKLQDERRSRITMLKS